MFSCLPCGRVYNGAQPMAGFAGLLQTNRNYRYTWMGQVVSEIGDYFNNVAVFSLAVATTKSGLVVSGVLLARAIPAALAGPLAGVTLDRLDRKRIMIASDVDPRRGGARLHPHRQRPRHLAALRAQRPVDGGFAVLHQRALGHPALHRQQGRAAHRQFPYPDHPVEHTRRRRLPRRHHGAIRLSAGFPFQLALVLSFRHCAFRAFSCRAAVFVRPAARSPKATWCVRGTNMPKGWATCAPSR